jgi:hypothetical protein
MMHLVSLLHRERASRMSLGLAVVLGYRSQRA